MQSAYEYALSEIDAIYSHIDIALANLDSIEFLENKIKLDLNKVFEIDEALRSTIAFYYIGALHNLTIAGGKITPNWRNKGMWENQLNEINNIKLSLCGMFRPTEFGWQLSKSTLDSAKIRLKDLKESLARSMDEQLKIREKYARDVEDQHQATKGFIRRITTVR